MSESFGSSVAGLPRPPSFNVTPESLIDEAKALLQDAKIIEDDIIAKAALRPPQNLTFKEFILPLAHAENDAIRRMAYIGMLRYLAPDPAVRKAATEGISYITSYFHYLFLRKEVFHILEIVWDNNELLDPEDHMFLKIHRQTGIQNGLQLQSGEAHEKFREIGARLLELRWSFMHNLTEDQEELLLLRSELIGVPEQYLQGLQIGTDEKLRLPLKGPDVRTVLVNCTVSETRRKVFEASENQCPSNVPIFQETIQLRHESALLLNYQNYAEMRLTSL